MSSSHSGSFSRRRENGTPSRWDQYRELLVRKQVPHKAQRWYVVHVETFLKELRPNSLSQLTARQVTDYFQAISRHG
jgi:hypothetical protein